MNRPTKKLWQSAKPVLWYLKGSQDFGVTFWEKEERSIAGFLNADWMQKRPSRMSIFGLFIKCADGTVDWRSNQQTIVAQSSKEKELVGLALCVRNLL